MELHEIIPDKPEFKLSATGEIVHCLRPPTLEDRIIFDKKFTNRRVMNALQANDWEIISFMVLHLMVDKSAYKAHDIEEQTADGEMIKRRVLGPEIFRKQVQKISDQAAVLGAISSAIVNSDPDIKKITEEHLKKKMMEFSQPEKTGEESLTSSQVNMDGQPTAS